MTAPGSFLSSISFLKIVVSRASRSVDMPTLSGGALLSWRAAADEMTCWAPAANGAQRTAITATTGSPQRREVDCKLDFMGFPPRMFSTAFIFMISAEQLQEVTLLPT